MTVYNNDYYRYADDKGQFFVECFEQADSQGVVMSDEVAEKIWTDLQSMSEPKNFKFDMIERLCYDAQ